jgi:hypothetical protein
MTAPGRKQREQMVNMAGNSDQQRNIHFRKWYLHIFRRSENDHYDKRCSVEYHKCDIHEQLHHFIQFRIR